jgi:hypothetical protein
MSNMNGYYYWMKYPTGTIKIPVGPFYSPTERDTAYDEAAANAPQDTIFKDKFQVTDGSRPAEVDEGVVG